ncbi:hypothetical protein Tcan_06190 [Toxocara canis]|uniref:Uncharacterized protein n=1 Tax=Toxocara canis TaxID=6265 RepID=A0A0B2V5X1_TOXCA|nr:hypothetical protein Tcan_06190 [Toxocara canis]
MDRETSSAVTLDSSIKLANDSSSFRCLRGTISIVNGMRLVLVVGMFALLTILSLEIVYFRRAIFILMIPASVILITVLAIVRQKHHLVWPIIAISVSFNPMISADNTTCFHIFVSLYFGLIFLYYYFFKPLYIIMVLNWAFDTLYTQKTTSYYIQCAVIFASIVAFGLFNVWQLALSCSFKDYLQGISAETRNSTPSVDKTSVSLVVNRSDSPSHNHFRSKPCFD